MMCRPCINFVSKKICDFHKKTLVNDLPNWLNQLILKHFTYCCKYFRANNCNPKRIKSLNINTLTIKHHFIYFAEIELILYKIAFLSFSYLKGREVAICAYLLPLTSKTSLQDKRQMVIKSK